MNESPAGVKASKTQLNRIKGIAFLKACKKPIKNPPVFSEPYLMNGSKIGKLRLTGDVKQMKKLSFLTQNHAFFNFSNDFMFDDRTVNPNQDPVFPEQFFFHNNNMVLIDFDGLKEYDPNVDKDSQKRKASHQTAKAVKAAIEKAGGEAFVFTSQSGNGCHLYFRSSCPEAFSTSLRTTFEIDTAQYQGVKGDIFNLNKPMINLFVGAAEAQFLNDILIKGRVIKELGSNALGRFKKHSNKSKSSQSPKTLKEKAKNALLVNNKALTTIKKLLSGYGYIGDANKVGFYAASTTGFYLKYVQTEQEDDRQLLMAAIDAVQDLFIEHGSYDEAHDAQLKKQVLTGELCGLPHTPQWLNSYKGQSFELRKKEYQVEKSLIELIEDKEKKESLTKYYELKDKEQQESGTSDHMNYDQYQKIKVKQQSNFKSADFTKFYLKDPLNQEQRQSLIDDLTDKFSLTELQIVQFWALAELDCECIFVDNVDKIVEGSRAIDFQNDYVLNAGQKDFLANLSAHTLHNKYTGGVTIFNQNLTDGTVNNVSLSEIRVKVGKKIGKYKNVLTKSIKVTSPSLFNEKTYKELIKRSLKAGSPLSQSDKEQLITQASTQDIYLFESLISDVVDTVVTDHFLPPGFHSRADREGKKETVCNGRDHFLGQREFKRMARAGAKLRIEDYEDNAITRYCNSVVNDGNDRMVKVISDKDQKALYKFLAVMLQQPDKQTGWMLTLLGSQGLGKDKVIDLMGGIIRNGAFDAKPDDLLSDFNKFAKYRLIKFSEMHGKANARKVTEALKLYIAGGKTLTVNEKFQPQRKIVSNGMYVANVNNIEDLYLEAGQRRNAVITFNGLRQLDGFLAEITEAASNYEELLKISFWLQLYNYEGEHYSKPDTDFDSLEQEGSNVINENNIIKQVLNAIVKTVKDGEVIEGADINRKIRSMGAALEIFNHSERAEPAFKNSFGKRLSRELKVHKAFIQIFDEYDKPIKVSNGYVYKLKTGANGGKLNAEDGLMQVYNNIVKMKKDDSESEASDKIVGKGE